MVCTGPVSYRGQDAVQRDIARLKAAVAEHEVAEAFLPAACPMGFGLNEYYATEDEYMAAVAEALREEYLAIVDAGLILQVDDPWLIELLMEDPSVPPAERRAAAAAHVELINHALRGIPPERVRLHTCYGLNHGPRLHDVAFSDVVGFMLEINAGAYSFEVGNPRHQHEWRIWETTSLPDGKVLMPGFLCHAHNFVEHPRLIADGIVDLRRTGRPRERDRRAPTAASRRARSTRRRSTRRSSGPSSRRWPKAPGSPRSSSGEPTMSELVERALAWVAEVHPHARHLARTREWVLVLDPQAGEALEIAAVIHDIERAFPADDDPFDPTAPPGRRRLRGVAPAALRGHRRALAARAARPRGAHRGRRRRSSGCTSPADRRGPTSCRPPTRCPSWRPRPTSSSAWSATGA